MRRWSREDVGSPVFRPGSPRRPGAASEGLAVDPKDPRFADRPDLVRKLTATPHGYFRFVNAGLRRGDLPPLRRRGRLAARGEPPRRRARRAVRGDEPRPRPHRLRRLREGRRGHRPRPLRGLAPARRPREGLGGRGGALRRRVPPGLPCRAARRGRRALRRTWSGARAPGSSGTTLSRCARPTPSSTRLPCRSTPSRTGSARSPSSSGSAGICPRGFFEVKRVGALTMGVGSALDEKYLIIFEGYTAAAEDDIVVEAKQIRDLAGNPCVRTDVGGLARPRRAEADRLRAVRLRGGRPPRGQVLLGARLDGRLPGSLHRLGHPLAARPARGGVRRRGPDGPRAPEAPRRGTQQGSPAGGPQVAGRDRGPGARRDSRDGGQDRGGVGGVQAGSRRPDRPFRGAFHGGFLGNGPALRDGAEADETATGKIRGVLRTPRGVTTRKPSRGRRRRARRRGP